MNKSNFLLLKPALIAILIIHGAAEAGMAEAVAVSNPSFEANILPDGGISPSIIGWIASPGGGDGVFNPTSSQYPGGAAPDGQNVAYVNNPGNHVNQTLAAVLEADTTYSLRVLVGRRLDEPLAGYRVQLRAGGTVLAEDNSSQSPAPGSFVAVQVDYSSLPADPQLGQSLEIWLLAPGIQANFDNVRLDKKVLPVELMTFSVE